MNSANLTEYRAKCERLKGQKKQFELLLEQVRTEKAEAEHKLDVCSKAIAVVQEVGVKTQQLLQYHISGTVSAALEIVFDEPYEFEADFVQKRGRTECELYFTKNGSRINPMQASGGGAIDVASFALRVACWVMNTPKTRPVLFLDEPFRYLSEGLLPKAGDFLRRISDKFGLQIIMVTHSEQLIDSADRIFYVSQDKKGVSGVKVEDSD